MGRTVVQVIASAIQARANCIKSGNKEWQERWEERLLEMEQRLPSGSGFDSGTKIDLDRSWPNRRPASFITLTTSYHHMNEHGYYTHWTEHDVIVRPAFEGHIDLTIRTTDGKVDDSWKDYAGELFYSVLTEIVEEYRFKRGDAVILREGPSKPPFEVKICKPEMRYNVAGYWVDTSPPIEMVPFWVPEEAVYPLPEKK